MSERGSGGGRTATVDLRTELLGRLGLEREADDQDIEGAYRDVVDFLDTAPADLATWARLQRGEAERAFALLAGSEEALEAEAGAAAPAPAKARPARPAPVEEAPARSRRPQGPLVWLLGALVVAGIVLGVYWMGKDPAVPGISGTPTSTATSQGIDQAQVAALMQKISANPKDVASLQGLGDQYYQAGDYKTAADWENKVLAIEPKNQTALLALGATQFNLGNAAEAEKVWLQAAKLYPNNAEVHYDLGFLYMSKSPSDTTKMRAEWQKVIDIDPNSDLAKTVSTHLNQSTPSPSATN